MKSVNIFSFIVVFAAFNTNMLVNGKLFDAEMGVENSIFRYYQNATENKETVNRMLNWHRLLNGQRSVINSMCLLTEGAPWYTLSYITAMLNFGPQYFVTSALAVADTSNTPPTVKDGFFTGLCVYPNCDYNYHASKIFLNSDPYFQWTIPAPFVVSNSLAIFKTKEPVEYKSQCGSPPLEPAWISCDTEGPPVNYTDCFMTSYGTTQLPEEEAAPEFIKPNRVRMKALSASDCEVLYGEPTSFNQTSQICTSTIDGTMPYCSRSDGLPFLFCKYWKQEDQQSFSGWGWKSNGPSLSSGQGWQGPKRQNLLAVGLFEGGSVFSCPEPGVSVFLKFGATAYRKIFSECGYYCSKDLNKGYRCKGNPPKSLGPVYCMPEKIPTSNNGWSS